MEKSLYLCLQPKLHPQDLIKSEDGLCKYVLLGSNDENRSDDLDRAYYDYSIRNEGKHKIDSTVGYRQAELLVRSAHRALDDVSSNPQKSWDATGFACDRLWYNRIFEKYSGQHIMHRTSPHLAHFHLLPFSFRSAHSSGSSCPPIREDIHLLSSSSVTLIWMDRYYSPPFESTKQLFLPALLSNLALCDQSTHSHLDQDSQVCLSPIQHWR